MTSWKYFAVVIVASAVVTCAVMPMVMWLSRRLGAVAEPDERRVHTRPTPTLGGLAMFIGLGVGLLVAALSNRFTAVFESPVTIIGIAGAALVIFVTGFVDDVREVSAPAKLGGMVLAGSVLSLAGVTIVNVPLPGIGFTVLAPDLAVLISVLWVVVMANAVNLIDGLDGLAAGVVAIAAGSFLIYSLRLEQVGSLEPGNPGPLVAAIAVGICLGFLPWNFHPAKVFMGDSGALLLGLLMASSTIAVGGQSDDSYTGQSWFFFGPLVLPLLLLAVPLLDMVFSVVRRAKNRQGLSTADKGHLHHRLLELGHGQRRAVVILWGFTALCSAFALIPALIGSGAGVVPILLGAAALVGFAVLFPRLGRIDASHGVDSGTKDGSGERPGGDTIDDRGHTVDPHPADADRVGDEATGTTREIVSELDRA